MKLKEVKDWVIYKEKSQNEPQDLSVKELVLKANGYPEEGVHLSIQSFLTHNFGKEHGCMLRLFDNIMVMDDLFEFFLNRNISFLDRIHDEVRKYTLDSRSSECQCNCTISN